MLWSSRHPFFLSFLFHAFQKYVNFKNFILKCLILQSCQGIHTSAVFREKGSPNVVSKEYSYFYIKVCTAFCLTIPAASISWQLLEEIHSSGRLSHGTKSRHVSVVHFVGVIYMPTLLLLGLVCTSQVHEKGCIASKSKMLVLIPVWMCSSRIWSANF